LAALPERIDRLEAEIARLHQAMAGPEFYKRPGKQIAAEISTLADLENQLAAALRRWEALEERTA
jgi:ATP-binding cassette subfamily F protein uup